MIKYLDFEKPIEDIDKRISLIDQKDENLINKYNEQKKKLFLKIYKSLSSWQKVQIARHPNRPHTIDYINNIFTKFIYLAGDKRFADDQAIIGGLANIDEYSVMVIGNEKGSSVESRIKHNFGMSKPEGYRKVQRLFSLAEKFKIPVITFVDTPGAFPGKDAEERGQSESIAVSIAESLKLNTQIISIIIGEGGSGGAIALATADKVLMLENSIYSVISPEGCASILWRNTEEVQKAAEALKLTAKDCLNLRIIDEILEEKPGGAHRYPTHQFNRVKDTIISSIKDLLKVPVKELVHQRNEKYLNITSG